MGDELDALDSEKQWFESVVVETKKDELGQHHILIQYKGWSSKWNTWKNVDSQRDEIAPVGTYSDGEYIPRVRKVRAKSLK